MRLASFLGVPPPDVYEDTRTDKFQAYLDYLSRQDPSAPAPAGTAGMGFLTLAALGAGAYFLFS